MATRLRITADCIEGKRRFRKPPKLAIGILHKLDSAARFVEHRYQQGMSIDDAVMSAMMDLGIFPADDPDKEQAIRDRILATRRKLKK